MAHVFVEGVEEEGYSRMVSGSEIRAANFNLVVARYVGNADSALPVVDLPAAIAAYEEAHRVRVAAERDLEDVLVAPRVEAQPRFR